MSWRGAHRWLALALIAPLVVWSLTGLLFHLKPGWGRAYDLPSIERADALAVARLVPPAQLVVDGEITHVELFTTALGPLYRVTTARGPALYDATTGARRSPLSADDAAALIRDAVARSPHAAAYGATIAPPAVAERAVTLAYASAVVELGRDDGALQQRGADTDRIDWLYRLHYLQWTGQRTLDRALGIVGLVVIWAAMIAGVVLFVRGRRR